MNRFGIKVYYNDFSKKDGNFIDHYFFSYKYTIKRRIIGNIIDRFGIVLIFDKKK